MQLVAATEVIDDHLESADHIAYQYSNLIQPNTLFLNVDRRSHSILNVSSNVDQWLGLNSTEVLGLVLDDDLCVGIAAVLDEVEERPIGQTYLFDQCFSGVDKKALLLESPPHPNGFWSNWSFETTAAMFPSIVDSFSVYCSIVFNL